jgi:hypothetical protein
MSKKKDLFSVDDFSKVKVMFVKKGESLKVKRFKEGHKPEIVSFNFAVIDFGPMFKEVRGQSLPSNLRINESTPEIQIVGSEAADIKRALAEVTRLANLPTEPYEDEEKRYLYQKALARVCKPMVDKIHKEGIDKVLGMLIERGALLIGAFYDFPEDQVARVLAKRLDKADDTLGLGLSDLRLPPNMERFTKLHIQEDCIATGDTISGLILALKKKGIFFDEIQIDCPAATQVGIEFIIAFLKWLGVKKVLINTGALVYALDDHYYLRRTIEEGYEDKGFFVGDMGEWSKKLPVSYNKTAWWNKNR